ncbi:L-type lectin-domain containing receptor kinase IX.1 [Abeliophyllum distichum]|uniref:L-type lectin-domain containing receptor kinase IX.1 n=1 Tax=Abeliophyllum distichum TaxID=126358 RepID=A0ABD1P908_9LAMI
MQLWDKASKNLTDFVTNFSFITNSLNKIAYGDGIAFFLAPAGSRIPDNVTKGGSMGLTTDYEPLNTTVNPFVAVEFDIYKNPWDPPGEHVGVDINSMESVVNRTWWSASSITEGLKHEAWISYDSRSKNNTYIRQRLSYVVDLRQYLPELVTFGFSAATGNASALHSIYSWSFSSTLEVNETDPRVVAPGPTSDSNSGRKTSSKNKTGLMIGLAVGGVTNNFSQHEKLGEGGFGGVYKGFLREINSYIAVKRVSSGSQQGIKEYTSEVKIISRLRHKNLVQLLGWCHEKKELLLVYEFMPNGSLDFHLFKGKNSLTWTTRFKVAQGLASALLYLHEEWEQCVVHRDIKSSNVMLDSNFNAKLGDFGFARLVDHEKGSQTTVLTGTMGYMAHECVITGRASKETNVYSFGVVALEIACGRKPIDPKAQEGRVNLVEWVWSLYGTGKLLEAADLKLDSVFNTQEMEYLMIVGLWCAHPDSDLRPSIRQAILVLKFEAPLPLLPLRMPVPMYYIPPGNMLSSPYGTATFGSRRQPTVRFDIQ